MKIFQISAKNLITINKKTIQMFSSQRIEKKLTKKFFLKYLQKRYKIMKTKMQLFLSEKVKKNKIFLFRKIDKNKWNKK